jgi:nicotinamide riboside kinase
VIRVVVTGSECTGKTTLAEALAAHYHTLWVPEYVRLFVQQKGSAPEHEDVDAVARGQMALEDERAANVTGLLIQDTDLLSTLVYSHHYYGDCPGWIEEALRKRAANLYLLAGIDVPWSPDGDQRDRGHRREEMHEVFRTALMERQLHHVDVRGTPAERLQIATAAIDALTGE